MHWPSRCRGSVQNWAKDPLVRDEKDSHSGKQRRYTLIGTGSRSHTYCSRICDDLPRPRLVGCAKRPKPLAARAYGQGREEFGGLADELRAIPKRGLCPGSVRQP